MLTIRIAKLTICSDLRSNPYSARKEDNILKNTTSPQNPSKGKTYDLALTGLMTAVICILGPISIPLPMHLVPISLGSLAVYFVIYVTGMKRGILSVFIYLLLGIAGAPVFTGFTGGIGKALGPTGGYLIGYLFLALLGGFFIDRFPDKMILHIAGMLLGTAFLYLFGTLWLAYLAHYSFHTALWAGVIPYIPGDLVKIFLAVLTGMQVKKRLYKI